MSKILFICSGNVGRSQIAEAYYNYLTKSKNALSAGIDPKTPAKYENIPDYLCQIMLEEQIDISKHKVKFVTKKMVACAVYIYIMCDRELCPDFLINSNKVKYWNIKDPYKMSIDKIRIIRDQIKKKVLSII